MIPDEIKDFVGIAGAPVVQALTEVIKVAFPNMPSRWYPSISVAIGVVFNVALSLIIKSDVPVAIVIGVVTGLLASGLFTWGKRTEV